MKVPENQARPRRNRSLFQLAADILESALEGKRITRVMSDAKISTSLQRRYVRFLLDGGFIEYDEAGQVYRTTHKGRKFLSHYHQLRALADLEKFETGH